MGPFVWARAPLIWRGSYRRHPSTSQDFILHPEHLSRDAVTSIFKRQDAPGDPAPADPPPADSDPAEPPPVEQPPEEQPPEEQPPAEQPPAEQPPAEQPPAEQPPAEQPPEEKLPAEQPADDQQPPDDVPEDQAPEGETPADGAPEEENPGGEPPGDDTMDEEDLVCDPEGDLPNDDPSDDASQTTPPETAQPSPKPTPPPENPTPTCIMQNALPDQYTSAFCRCHTKEGETLTLELLTVENPKVDSESCSYTKMPTKTQDNPVTELTPTYTVGCDVCAGPGGVENHDPDWCTAIPGCTLPEPTFALFLSDTSVSLGTAANDDEGKELGEKLVNKLKERCPKDGHQCSTEAFDVVDVPLIIDEGIENMILQATVDDSY